MTTNIFFFFFFFFCVCLVVLMFVLMLASLGYFLFFLSIAFLSLFRAVFPTYLSSHDH